MAIIRHAIQRGKPVHTIEDGKDFTLKSIKRIFDAADIGEGAGQTRHENGCLILSVSGPPIQDVITYTVFRVQDTKWRQPLDHKSSWALSLDKKDLFAIDESEGESRWRAGDILHLLVALGYDC